MAYERQPSAYSQGHVLPWVAVARWKLQSIVENLMNGLKSVSPNTATSLKHALTRIGAVLSIVTSTLTTKSALCDAIRERITGEYKLIRPME